MSDNQFVLTREQRDEISRAAAAIEECVKAMIAKPHAPPEIVVIWTNLTIIQSKLATLSQVEPD
jgi:hypothetical protein